MEKLKNKKTPVLTEAQMKIIAKKMGLNVKMTRDPNYKLTKN